MFEKINELFSALEKEFPYSTMGVDFKGRHAITRERDGVLVVSVWSKGSVYPIGVDPKDFEDINKFVADSRVIVDGWKKSG
jgi:hypothetical protein